MAALYAPLVDLVAAQMPDDPDRLRDVVFIMRIGLIAEFTAPLEALTEAS